VIKRTSNTAELGQVDPRNLPGLIEPTAIAAETERPIRHSAGGIGHVETVEARCCISGLTVTPPGTGR
jgi:hypothetical protein